MGGIFFSCCLMLNNALLNDIYGLGQADITGITASLTELSCHS